MKRINLFKTLFLLCVMIVGGASAWAEDGTYVPQGLRTITANTVVYCTDITSAGTPSTDWVVVPSYGTTSAKYTQITSTTDNGNPQGLTDNIATISSSVNMIQIKADGNTFSSSKRVIHMHVKGIVSVIAHGITSSSNRGLAISCTEYVSGETSTMDETSHHYDFKRSGNSGSLICQVTGLDATKEYIVSIYASGGDTRFYCAEFFVPGLPTITTQPQSAAYSTGQTIEALTVVATAAAGNLLYQWYSCDDAAKTNAAAIEGATSASYTPTAAGFYYVVVTDDNGSVESDVAEITVSAAEAPTINVTGAPTDAVVVGTEVILTATATGTPTPTITWYDNAQDAQEAGTGATFTVPTDAAGTYQYYAVASNGVGTDAQSALQTIVVKEQVAKPTITPNGAYFQESQEVTLACTTDGASILYSTDDGATWTTYTAALTFTETTTVKAKATKEDYIDSEIATATFTKFPKSDLVSISAKKTWTIPTSLTLELMDDGTTFPAKYDEYYTYSDIATINGNTLPNTFDGTTLAFSGQYPYRGSNGAQNCNLQFVTTVPGTVEIQFSNTGGSNKDRWVKVNDNTGSINAEGTTKRTETFIVSAGTVTITHVDKDGNLSNGLRFYSITFTPAVTATIAASGYTTLSSAYPLDFSGTIENLTGAYVVSELTATTAKFEAVTGVPAETGLVLEGTAEQTVIIPIPETVPTAPTTNYLQACVNGGTVASESVYALSGGQFKLYTGTELPAGKAYLLKTDVDAAGGSGAPLSFDFGGDVTGISTIDNGQQTTDNRWYDLSGRRVENPTKGMYIHNGKKVIVK